MNSIVTFSDKLSKLLMVLAAAWAFCLTFFIMLNISFRGIFDGMAEIVTASIVIIVFLQAGYAIRSRSMLRADFLVSRFPDGVQKFLLAFGYILGAIFFLMIIFGGWDESVLSWVENEFEGEGALRVPAWPARWAVMGGSAIALLNYLVLAYIDVFMPEYVDEELDANTGSGH
ncbi:MAG: TRAP transporter small permease [Rhodospirillales bacterium]|jgi:TRAP-type C4-dicarboxylate transport system permease small subunit|nr:TRAP transporter small permease [Rhodospirillales bacterium]MDC0989426.1 TRAP transporter small permease [Rhodospirillales bacterium]